MPHLAVKQYATKQYSQVRARFENSISVVWLKVRTSKISAVFAAVWDNTNVDDCYSKKCRRELDGDPQHGHQPKTIHNDFLFTAHHYGYARVQGAVMFTFGYLVFLLTVIICLKTDSLPPMMCIMENQLRKGYQASYQNMIGGSEQQWHKLSWWGSMALFFSNLNW